MPCPILLSDGQPCGRQSWRVDECILHDAAEDKPQQAFVDAVQGVVNGADPLCRVPGDLNRIRWHNVSFEVVQWTRNADFSAGYFSGDNPLGNCVFQGNVNFSDVRSVGALTGSPQFLADACFARLDCDGFRLSNVVFHGASDFSEIYYTSDSFISRCRFKALANFRRSRNWEMHFTKCAFEAGIDFAYGGGRVSIRGSDLMVGPVDLSGIHLFMEPLILEKFSGSFACRNTEFEKRLELRDCANLQTDFRGARFRAGLLIVRTEIVGDLSFDETVLEGAIEITDSEIAHGTVRFDRAIIAADRVHLARLNPTSGAPLQLRIGAAIVDRFTFEDIRWQRHHGRVVLHDESSSWQPMAAQRAAVTYRRVRERLEAAHLYEEAEDCVWGAMEMRRLDSSVPLRNRLGLWIYRLASLYGSSWMRAVGVLAALTLVLLPAAFLLVGLVPTPEKAPLDKYVSECCLADLVPPSIRDTLRLHQLKFIAQDLVRAEIHSLQLASFRDETMYQSKSILGHGVEAIGRAAVAAQLGLLILACRRRFSR